MKQVEVGVHFNVRTKLPPFDYERLGRLKSSL